MSSVKWERAKALAFWEFMEPPTDWPKRLSPEQLARLQAPGVRWDRNEWIPAIESAAQSGRLPSVLQLFRFKPEGAASINGKTATWGGGAEELPAIAADDFRAWLESEKEAPSEHIAAWVEARCTAPAESTAKSSNRTWTPERLAELKTFRDSHTMPETVEKYGISEQRIRKLLPKKKSQASFLDGLIHRAK